VTCEHSWDKIHEEGLFGGSFPVGYRCSRCNKYVGIHEVPITGMPGSASGIDILQGPHGGVGHTSDGKPYKRQIRHQDGRVEIT
jgi:hypothetical protein